MCKNFITLKLESDRKRSDKKVYKKNIKTSKYEDKIPSGEQRQHVTWMGNGKLSKVNKTLL